MRTEYKYQIGEVVNETLRIVRQTTLPNGRYKRKAYEVQSLVYYDAPTYISSESHLKRGDKCAYLRGRRVYEGNSLYSIEYLRPYIVDVEESKTVTPKSNIRTTFKCPQCNYKKTMKINTLFEQGISCPKCSKGTSYPELFMMAYLEVKGIEYEYQKVFDDLSNRRFDFYLPKENIVIETHGLQHYKEVYGHMDYQKIKYSDTHKRNYCKNNNILYVEIDARRSMYSHISNSINESCLPNISKRESKIILNNIENKRRYNFKYIITKYKEGKSLIYIAQNLNTSPKTIKNILLSLNYNIDSDRSKKRKVRCITTNEVFNSILEASKHYTIKSPSKIGDVCRGKKTYTGKHPITGEKLRWEYVDNE